MIMDMLRSLYAEFLFENLQTYGGISYSNGGSDIKEGGQLNIRLLIMKHYFNYFEKKSASGNISGPVPSKG